MKVQKRRSLIGKVSSDYFSVWRKVEMGLISESFLSEKNLWRHGGRDFCLTLESPQRKSSLKSAATGVSQNWVVLQEVRYSPGVQRGWFQWKETLTKESKGNFPESKGKSVAVGNSFLVLLFFSCSFRSPFSSFLL